MINTEKKHLRTIAFIMSIMTMIFLLCGCGQSKSTVDSQTAGEERINTISEEDEVDKKEYADTSADIEEEIAEIIPEQESNSKKSDLAQEYIDSITIDNAEQKGICGNDLMWFYKDNVLVIRGTGDMSDFAIMDNTGICPQELKNDIHWVIFEEGCTSIGRYAFDHYIHLSKVIFPDSLQNIGNSAFYKCTSLTEIEFPDSLQVIGERAFMECESLTKVDFPDSIQLIDDLAFQGCKSLTEIDFPDSIQSFGSLAFNNCISLSEETIQRLEAFGYEF